MSERRAIPLAAAVAAVLLIAAFATRLVPWLTRDRTIISSTPTTMPRLAPTDLRVRHGQRLCVRGVELDRGAQGLQLVVRRVGSAAVSPAIGVDVRAAGYRSSTRLAGGYPYAVAVVAPLHAPSRDVVGASVCLRDEGPPAALLATADPRELANVTVSLDGHRIVAQPWLTFVERRPASILARHTEILDRIAAFRPFPAIPPLIGLLALLVVLGVPAAVVAALMLAERDDDSS